VDPPTTRGIVQVVNHNQEWPDQFGRLRDRIWPFVSDVAVAVEHVGSTAVNGLAAKPVIDIDIVIPSRHEVPLIVMRLGHLGYEHRGNLGIEDREAFSMPENQPAHNLYVCPRDSIALRNHIAFRDHLRTHRSDVVAYSSLKKQLSERFAHDINRYVEGKTDFILSILAQYGFAAASLDAIRRANQSNGVVAQSLPIPRGSRRGQRCLSRNFR
jgi:GrpB-like predicted nucleotidyltransferase (UPF0157 family)